MSRKREIEEHFQGMREGVELYAHWKNGVQYVGTCGRTLKDAILDIDVQERKVLAELKKFK